MWHSIPLTLFWFVYFGSLGIFYPYFALYLRENAGLTGTQVGLILAISPFIGMLTQPFWGHLADRTGARSRMLARSEEHTSELQSRRDLVCRLLLEKKKKHRSGLPLHKYIPKHIHHC